MVLPCVYMCEALPQFACRCDLIVFRVSSCVRIWSELAEIGRGALLIQVCRIPLLDSSMDLTRDRDDSFLLDPIFFGPFSQSYASSFNKTSRLRSLDSLKAKTPETYNIISLPRPYIRPLCALCILKFCIV